MKPWIIACFDDSKGRDCGQESPGATVGPRICKQGPRDWLRQTAGAAAPSGGRELREANDRGGHICRGGFSRLDASCRKTRGCFSWLSCSSA
ncbi:MAG: hypothetical protein B7Y42_08520 [Polaromonas sp. 28-63-22]|nr:MAG: hypothetical protein B7Y42_08520 [Polaromonas sp. 28-63-22]